MEIKRITKEELKQKIDKNEDCIVIDVRNQTAYAGSPVKIKGALRMTVDDIEALSKNLPKKEIITYCT